MRTIVALAFSLAAASAMACPGDKTSSASAAPTASKEAQASVDKSRRAEKAQTVARVEQKSATVR